MPLRRLLAILALVLGAAAIAAPVASAHRGHHRHHHRHPALVQSQPAAAVPVCANGNLPASSTPPRVLDAAVVCLVNQQRVSRGLPALQPSAGLDRSAQGWTDLMVAKNIFSHGSDFSSRISAAGINWSFAGENIATGYPTPAAVVSAWMASLDHCRNILDPSYALVGTGVNASPIAPFGSGAGAATWTQDFALLANRPVPSHSTGPASGCPYR